MPWTCRLHGILLVEVEAILAGAESLTWTHRLRTPNYPTIILRHLPRTLSTSSIRGGPTVKVKSLERIPLPKEQEEKLQKFRTRSIPIQYDTFQRRPAVLLRSTLKGLLPHWPYLNSIPEAKRRWLRKEWIAPGFHHLYFPLALPTRTLLPDGTDTMYHPGEPWNNRLWVGGRLQLFMTLEENAHYVWRVEEIIKNVVVRGRPGSEKVFVTLRRAVGMQSGLPKSEQPEYHYLRPTDGESISAHTALMEDRTLCFMREQPAHSAIPVPQRSSSIDPPPSDPFFSHNLVPTPALLFRFSALTFNAHAIHIDPEYARRVYGLPNLVVHGPLTLILMLEVARRAFFKYTTEHNLPLQETVDIEYKNMSPLFVNEPMTIGCKPLTPDAPKAEGQQWFVWISKGSGQETTMAVKATLTTKPIDFWPKENAPPTSRFGTNSWISDEGEDKFGA